MNPKKDSMTDIMETIKRNADEILGVTVIKKIPNQAMKDFSVQRALGGAGVRMFVEKTG